MKDHALASFHRAPENYNCAQAVLHGYQAATGDTTLSIADLKTKGGGRAPDNLCGALHAACLAAPQVAQKITEDFATRAGSIRCRELKQVLKFPCVDCVGLAAELAAQNLK